jgi:hypothetical protein
VGTAAGIRNNTKLYIGTGVAMCLRRHGASGMGPRVDSAGVTWNPLYQGLLETAYTVTDMEVWRYDRVRQPSMNLGLTH